MSFSEKQNIQTRTYKVEKGTVLSAVTAAFEDLGYIITQKEDHYISAKIETIIPLLHINVGNTLIASASITDTEAGTKVKLNFIEVRQDSVFLV